MAMMTTIAGIAKQVLGITDEEENDFRKFQPPWAKNSRWIFLGKDPSTAELKAVNASGFDPYAYVTDPMIAIMNAVHSKDSITDTMLEVTKEVFRPWVSEQMLISAILEAKNGKTDRGKTIWNITDSDYVKALKSTAHVAKTLEPATIQRTQKRIIPAFRDEQPTYGRKLEPWHEIGRELTGISYEKFNYKTALAFKATEFRKNDADAEFVIREPFVQIRKTSPDEIIEGYNEGNERKLKLWKEMRQVYNAAIRRGVSQSEARSILKSRGLPTKDTLAIATGRFQPYAISAEVLRRARELKREIPMAKIRAAEGKFRNQSLDK
jgi:hypothetical protein